MNRHYTEYGERILSSVLSDEEALEIIYSMLRSMSKNEMDEYLDIKSAKRMAVMSQQWDKAACHRDTEKEIEKKFGLSKEQYKFIKDDMIVDAYRVIKKEEQREEQINKILK